MALWSVGCEQFCNSEAVSAEASGPKCVAYCHSYLKLGRKIELLGLKPIKDLRLDGWQRPNLLCGALQRRWLKSDPFSFIKREAYMRQYSPAKRIQGAPGPK